MWGGGGPNSRPPSQRQEVPDYLNWDLWLGPAADRPYHEDWTRWARWRDFGSGHPGMWGSHLWATPFKAMRLDTRWPINNETLEFDPVSCRVTNHPQADAELHPHYREGWTL